MTDEPGSDLFARWLAHREGRSADPAEPAGAEASGPERADPEEWAPPAALEEPTETYAEDMPDQAAVPDEHRAAASVLAALRPEPEPEASPPPEHEPGSAHEPAPEHEREPFGVEQPAPAPAVPERTVTLPHTIFFKPRATTQRVLGLLLLPFLAATVIAAVWAWHDRTYLSYGITAVLAVVSGVIWATRASASSVRMTMHGSELEIMRGGSRAVFDLAAPHTGIEMPAEPGDRRWKVLILRRSMRPYVIDSSMVDPAAFTRVLRYYRPEI